MDNGLEQAALWNGPSGRAWVETQAVLDQMFKPFEDLLVESASRQPEAGVLDVGCGTGATTLAISRRLGARGRCTGVDVSEPMIAAARGRAERERVAPRFLCADAETHPFDPKSFDLIVSRFGVMFFADPVAAFANLRGAAAENGRLHFVAWRGQDENPFMALAPRAAALLPDLPARAPGAPGQFAFVDADRVRAILSESGWTAIEIRPIDVICTLPESGLIPYLTRLGPVGLALGEADEPTRTAVVDALRLAYAPFIAGDEVRFPAACWSVEADA